jgi:hypothetical protein
MTKGAMPKPVVGRARCAAIKLRDAKEADVPFA